MGDHGERGVAATDHEGVETMSGGTPTQNAVLLTVLGALAAALVLGVLLGRQRRARATGSAEAGSVRSRGQAREIADRLHSYCAGPDASSGERDGADPPRVWVRGAARLLAVLRADRRFEVTPRATGEEYWSFTVNASGPGSGDGEDLCRGMVEILSRNGVTATASPDGG